MKNRVIRERYAALVALSQRVLPSPTAVHKVSALIATRFQRPYEGTEASRKAIILQHPTPEGWEGQELPPAIAEARQAALDEMLEQDTPVGKIPPLLRLSAADLPKAVKREGGDDNTAQLAQIVVLLGGLYVPGEAELALRVPLPGEDDAGQEPD